MSFHKSCFHQDDFKTMTMIKDGITYKRNKDGDWEEKIGHYIITFPCCDYIDCDFFSTKKKRAEYKKEVREHKRKVHGVDTIFVDET